MCYYADLLRRNYMYADMALENVSLCRSDAAMPHMCHYADYYAGVKRQPQNFVSQDLRYLEHAGIKRYRKLLIVADDY